METFSVQAGIDERWFGDGAPYWLEGRLDLASKTSGEARQQRRRDVKVLRRHAKADPAALTLARTMEACRPEQRCGACAECKRARQRAFVAAGARVLSRGSLKVMALSVVLAYQAVRVGHLGDPEQLFGELSRIARRALRTAHIPWALGGFDVSVNEHRRGRFQPHYRPHIWMFVPRFAFERGERSLSLLLPDQRERAAPRRGEPVRRRSSRPGVRPEAQLHAARHAASRAVGRWRRRAS